MMRTQGWDEYRARENKSHLGFHKAAAGDIANIASPGGRSASVAQAMKSVSFRAKIDRE